MKAVSLHKKQEFIAVLEDYTISMHAKKILHDVEYVVLIGPAAGGRNTIINELVATGKYHQVISDTTRPPKLRDGKLEQHGVNYFFRTEDEFLEDLHNGEFLEAELIHNQQVSGTSIRELQVAIKQKKIAINEVEYGGAKNILEAKPDSKVFAIFPPSYIEWYTRFASREEITSTEFVNRLRTVDMVLKTIQQEPRIQVIINDDYTIAAQELDDAMQGKDTSEQTKAYTQSVIADFKKNVASELKAVRK